MTPQHRSATNRYLATVATALTPYRRPLRASQVLGTAWAMLRTHFGRVAGAAVVFFVPLALTRHLAHDYFEDIRSDSFTPFVAFALLFVTLASAIALFGPVMFAGYLEAAVGAEHHGEGRHSLGEVLRTLPWWRLVGADLVVVIIVAVGLAALVVPGLIAATLLALVGPLIGMERLRSLEALRYSARLVRPYFWKVLLLVELPLAVEHTIEEELDHILARTPLVTDLIGTWVVAVVVFGFIGLMEVAIAYELVARAEAARTAGAPDAPAEH